MFEKFFRPNESKQEFTVKPTVPVAATTELEKPAEAHPEIASLEREIRVAQFELDSSLRKKVQAELELASIQTSWGSEPSDYEKLAMSHLEEANKEIEKYSAKLEVAKSRLSEIRNN